MEEAVTSSEQYILRLDHGLIGDRHTFEAPEKSLLQKVFVQPIFGRFLCYEWLQKRAAVSVFDENERVLSWVLLPTDETKFLTLFFDKYSLPVKNQISVGLTISEPYPFYEETPSVIVTVVWGLEQDWGRGAEPPSP